MKTGTTLPGIEDPVHTRSLSFYRSFLVMSEPPEFHGRHRVSNPTADKAAESEQELDALEEDNSATAQEGNNTNTSDGFIRYLQEVGRQYQAHLEVLTEEQRRKEMEGVTFRPEISRLAMEKRRQGPVEDRLHDLWRRKNEQQERERKEAERQREKMLKEEQSHPLQLSEAAIELKRRGTHKPIFETTGEWMESHSKKLDQLRDAAIKRECEELQPGPRIKHVAGIEERKRGMSVEDYLLTFHGSARHRRGSGLQTAEDINEIQRDVAGGGGGVDNNATGQPSAARSGRGAVTADVVTRLYNPNFKVPAYDPEFIEHCTFTPKTYSQYRDPLAHLPPHVRVMERSHLRRERDLQRSMSESVLLRDQDGRHINATPSFLNERSKEILRLKKAAERGEDDADADSDDASPGTRLHRDAEKRQERLVVAHQRQQVEEAEAAPFHPHVNPKSEAIAARKLALVGPSSARSSSKKEPPLKGASSHISFDDRLKIWQAQQRQQQSRRDALKHDQLEREMADCTFQPAVVAATSSAKDDEHRTMDGGSSHGDPQSPPTAPAHRRNSTPRKVVVSGTAIATRCSVWSKQRESRIERLKESVSNEERAQCSFAPQVHHEVPLPRTDTPIATGVELHLRRQREARERSQAAASKTALPVWTGKPTVPFDVQLRTDSVARRRVGHGVDGDGGRIRALEPPVTPRSFGAAAAAEGSYDGAFDSSPPRGGGQFAGASFSAGYYGLGSAQTAGAAGLAADGRLVSPAFTPQITGNGAHRPPLLGPAASPQASHHGGLAPPTPPAAGGRAGGGSIRDAVDKAAQVAYVLGNHHRIMRELATQPGGAARYPTGIPPASATYAGGVEFGRAAY